MIKKNSCVVLSIDLSYRRKQQHCFFPYLFVEMLCYRLPLRPFLVDDGELAPLVELQQGENGAGYLNYNIKVNDH